MTWPGSRLDEEGEGTTGVCGVLAARPGRWGCGIGGMGRRDPGGEKKSLGSVLAHLHVWMCSWKEVEVKGEDLGTHDEGR